MLAEPEHVEPDAVSKLHLLQDIGEGLVDAGRRIAPGLDEGVDAEFHSRPRLCLAALFRPRGRDDSMAYANESTEAHDRAADQPIFRARSPRSAEGRPRADRDGAGEVGLRAQRLSRARATPGRVPRLLRLS